MARGKYGTVFSIGLQNTFVYRWNFLLKTLFSLIPLAATVFVWRAVFSEGGSDTHGYDFHGIVFYFLLTNLVDTLVTPTEDEWQIAAEIRDGRISAFLTKPVDYLAYRLSLYASYRIVYTSVTLLPLALLFWGFHDFLRMPQSSATWPIFLLSLSLSALIQFLMAYLIAMLAFWILEISTIVFLLYSFEYFLSGQVFPLDLLPDSFQGVIRWMPFTYEVFFPVQIFLERIQGPLLWQGLAIQTLWAAILLTMARCAWNKGIRHYQAVGG